MKSIILVSAIIMVCLNLSNGFDCRCACCILNNIWTFNCTLVNQPIIDVADCSSCTRQSCINKYPTDCPADNSRIQNSCNSTRNSTQTNGSSQGQQTLVPLLILLVIISFFNIVFGKFVDIKL
ncbi:hypothetical protein I4U23_011420 [Adineta vaga]|nr:hypothetical protein I4U23_011420 [Adineta vaga]